MNVISFSLYGTDEKYWRGLLHNLELAPYIYPGWQVWVYCSENWKEPLSLIAPGKLARLFKAENSNNHSGLFWRFSPATQLKPGDRFIVRDADSRLNTRERAAVDEWIASGKPFHGMRDHKDHTAHIMGGMWGCKGSVIPDMEKLMSEWTQFNKGDDQVFLSQKIWPRIKDNSVFHDSNPDLSLKYFGAHDCRLFPMHEPMTYTQHVGEIIPC